MKKQLKFIFKTYFSIFIILLFAILFIVSIRWNGNSGENWKSIIASDGKGYYDYYRTFLFEKSPANQQANGIYLVETNNGVVNKYTCGLSIIWSPFVLPLYLLDENASNPYSKPYQIAISFAAFIFLFIGLFFLFHFLNKIGFSSLSINIGLIVFFFGTNLSFYSLLGCSMSHLYSFSLISVFLYYSYDFFLKKKITSLLIASFILGFITLIRPIGVLSVFLLFMFLKDVNSIKSFFSDFINIRWKVLIVVFLFFLPVSLQMIAWYFQTGSFIQWSYSGEGFYFQNPQIFSFLFSFRKGAFIYSPVLLFSFPALILIFRKKYNHALILFFALILIIYVLSSWWNWYYGDSFGMRSLIDFYALFIFLFVFLFDYFSKQIKIKVLLISLSFFFILLNLFQSYQYYYSIMSHFDMNYSKYKYIFGKYSNTYQNVLGGNSDIIPFHKKPLQCIGNVFFKADSVIESSYQEFLCLNKFEMPSHLELFDKLHLTIELEYFSTDVFPQSNQRIELIGRLDSGEKYTISSFLVNQVPRKIADNWSKENYQISFIVESKNLKELELIVFNPQKRKFAIKNFSTKLYCLNALE